MTKSDFTFICNEVMVEPNLALENKFVCKILKEDQSLNSVANQIKLATVLSTEF